MLPPSSHLGKAVATGIAALAVAALAGGTVAFSSATADRPLNLSETTPWTTAPPSTLAHSVSPNIQAAAAPAAVAEPAAVKATQEKTAVPKSKRPATLVASSVLGRIVLIDTKTGKTTKVLYSLPANKDACDWVSDVNLSKDGKTVFFEASERFANDCISYIKQMPVAGGKPTLVAEGTAPSISPDGSKLTFSKFVNGSDGEGTMGITEVRMLSIPAIKYDTANASEVVYESECGCGIIPTSWKPDSRNLVVQELSCGCGGIAYADTFVLDTATKVRTQLAINTDYAKPAYGDIQVLPNNDVMTIEKISVATEEHPFRTKDRMVIMDPTMQKVKRVVAIGKADRWYEGSASDATGKYLMYLSNNDLMVADNGGRATKLANGVTSADW